MVWSPRQLGDLADTSRRAVRHYTEIGLLPEPEQGANGYSQYGVSHLIRLLRIRRLTRLGLTLPQIAALNGADQHPAQALRALDAELATRIDELQATRLELAVMLQRAAPTDLPLEVANNVEGLPEAERALVVVLSRLLDTAALETYVELLRPYRQDASVLAFDEMTHDVDEQTRDGIAAGIAAHLRRMTAAQWDQFQRVEAGAKARQHTINAAINNLYNDSQLDVMAKVQRLSPYTRGFTPST